jgi:hypothetical protein
VSTTGEPPASTSRMPNEPDPIDTAWHIHDALCDWTGKVDAKASFALSIESAVLIAILALATDDHRLTNLHHVSRVLFLAGIVGVIVGVLAAVVAVCPQIREKEVNESWQDNMIFFGHLKHWKQDALTAALKSHELLPMLSRQLIVMSEIAWKKHRLLQVSLICAVIGTALVGIAAMTK